LWVSDNEVQTRWRKYSFGLSFNYLRKDKPKNKDITVIPFKKWITEQHRRERLKVAPHAKAGHSERNPSMANSSPVSHG
jgi:hypothetical protein